VKEIGLLFGEIVMLRFSIQDSARQERPKEADGA
jgi:hypothetical protein